jgi:hypothetical protein
MVDLENYFYVNELFVGAFAFTDIRHGEYYSETKHTYNSVQSYQYTMYAVVFLS